MPAQAKQFYEFGPYRIDRAERLLLRHGQVVSLTPKVFDTLLVLAENSGHILTKDEVMKTVWPDTVVEETNLTKNISTLRKALGESPDDHQYIETIPWRGYRFVASVREVGGEDTELIVEERTRSHVLIKQEQTSALPLEASVEPAFIKEPSAPDTKAKRASKSKARLAVVAACAALVIAIVASILFLVTSRNQMSATTVITSIAVLPLENLSGDPSQEYFADGMTEELIGKLAQIGSLRVISRTSVMRYKAGGGKSLPEIARELNVDAVLEGTVQRSDGRVRVTAKLIHAATDSLLWARDYERDLTDVLKLQSEVARAVADEIRIQVTPEERARLASARNINPQAHEAYLLGQYHLSKNNQQDMNQAIEYFEHATLIAPDYAPAYAGLSDAWLQRGWVVKAGAIYKGVESQSRAAALKAIGLDEQLAEAHNSLGRIKLLYDWNWAGVEQEFKRALELDPGSADAHIFYGHLLVFLRRDDEAIREGQIAVQLDPLSSTTQSSLGQILFRARKYQEALTHQKRAVELEPRNAEAYFRLGDVYVLVGRYDQALAAFEKVGELTPEFESFRAGIARVYALTGKQREALHAISGLNADPMSLTAVYVALGDKDKAFRILEKAVEERSPVLVSLKADPFLENLHSDPRWKTLLRRMNFPTE